MPPPSPSQQRKVRRSPRDHVGSGGAGPSGSHPNNDSFFDEQRNEMIARYEGMLPYLEGTEKARVAGDLAALKYNRSKHPRLCL